MEIYDEIIPPFFNNNYEESREYFFNLFNITRDESKIILEKMRETCLEILNSENNDNVSMNEITHKIWLTDSEFGHLPSEMMLYLLKKHYSELNDFKHYLWCNNLEIGKQIITLIDCPNVELRNVNEFSDYMGRKLYNIFLKNKLFANASDILRIQIVHKYGGLYSDFGWVMTNNMPKYLKHFDIMLNGEVMENYKGYISHNVIYSKVPKHNIFNKMLSYLEDKKFLNEFLKNKNCFYIVELISPRFIMAAIPELCKNEKLITLTNHELTFSRHHNSSHQIGSFGSNTIDNRMAIITNEINEYIDSL
jgi:hypothetical protein